MPAPTPDDILASPPPLNAVTAWPYTIRPFPANDLLGVNGFTVPPKVAGPPLPVK